MKQAAVKLINKVIVNPKIRSKLYNGNHLEYNICNSKLRFMLTGGKAIDLFKQYNVVGGGLRDNIVCPVCYSSDRERLMMYFLDDYTEVFSPDIAVLHIAPEKNILNRFKNKKNKFYITGDIDENRADYKVDITDIPFDDNTFNYVICNHVLEHVEKEQKALHEMVRVLKPEGEIILSFPLALSCVKTNEDKSIIDPLERLKQYGQEDHVRLYGLDVINRFYNMGISAKEWRFEDKKKLIKYGININERIYTIEKRKQ